MRSILALDPPHTHGLIRSRDLLSLGLSSHRIHQHIAQGELIRVRQGVLIARALWQEMSETERYITRVRATSLTVSRQLTFSHESAAALWGLPVPHSRHTRVHALDPHPGGGGGYRGLTIHRMEPDPGSTVHNGLRTTSLERTLIDLARRLSLVDSVPAIDHALRHFDGCTPEHLREYADTLVVSQRGFHRMHRALLLSREGAESVGESISRVRMHELGFADPVLQKTFEGLPFRVDFWWPEAQVIGEFDGQIKYVTRASPADLSPADVVWREKRREDELRTRCRRFVRWDWAVARSPQRLATLLTEAGVPRPRIDRTS
ncbi:hypothetical protein GCM10022198_01690 [Klugiella xanthotipulae]|uniref:AbiEi antitoxin N-terminal domain-containing protein n=1 Tax=Klugiella xanthotipulae TaxID=244735 RepID=A0A543I514_9MICO|nr:type IV toxin-antitoxin system AbiEi family antitoxin domain-containing protein [Klugiella xanthotipulae]TQM65693.1 hypothetical protein FB466_0505 [Klugiella xanthotipulae]